MYHFSFSFQNIVTTCQDHYSISQISPKSALYEAHPEDILPSIAIDFNIADEMENLQTHMRVERSAQPILNDASTYDKGRELNRLDSNDVETAGKYFNSINPTNVQDGTGKMRTGKELMNEDSFLGERGRRAKSSRPLLEVSPTSVMSTESTATQQLNNPRQNQNHDIQNIITGIVKLLNGNVNVHTNNQGTRRPPSNRINNRGPPRISEAQVPINDIQEPSKVAQPYPFDRPDGPLRPFLTGVPIPEQIVPSMQQNYRPGFISQNRPPWQRPRPRPPINANRRPIPPYRPIPTLTEYLKPEEEKIIHQNLSEPNEKPVNEADIEIPNDEDDDVSIEEETSPDPLNKDELKKKPEKKKPFIPVNEYEIQSTPSLVTIIQSTSEVNAVPEDDKTFIKSTEEFSASHLESSINDDGSISQYTTSIIETPTLIPVTTIETFTSISQPEIISTPSFAQGFDNLPPTQFHPRPGLVLDDPEFKPGQKNPANQGPHRQRLPPSNQQSPNLPPGYGEIFDITLSAIQGPNGGGSQQTLNIKPYGTYEGSDIILTPSGDQAFVSIDGKRSYINLFGDSTDAPTISSTQVLTKPQINPTGVLAPGITGSGYVVAETEPTIKKPHHTQSRPVHRPRLPAQQPPVRIDTCIVGDDSTCDQAQNEKCKTENGVSSCNCRPGKYLSLFRNLFEKC